MFIPEDASLTLCSRPIPTLLHNYSPLLQEGKLCATPFGVDVVGISESVALLGALVGGISARQRKDELEKLNEQLRKINLQLRQQARAGTIYAPGWWSVVGCEVWL